MLLKSAEIAANIFCQFSEEEIVKFSFKFCFCADEFTSKQEIYEKADQISESNINSVEASSLIHLNSLPCERFLVLREKFVFYLASIKIVISLAVGTVIKENNDLFRKEHCIPTNNPGRHCNSDAI